MRLSAFCFFAASAWAQTSARHEIGLTLGRVSGSTASGVTAGPGRAWQANYGLRLLEMRGAAVYFETHLLAAPLRDVASSTVRASRDFASLYVTPGLRVKFRSAARVSPYVAAGGGYALYENATMRLDGRPNEAPRTNSTGALLIGGGVDMRMWRWLGVRAEVRDFVTGRPAYNLAVPGRQHNVTIGGGFVISTPR
ncbi:MAG: outer membrane beta-barrel protein [Bryobacterales bacterium]|nr:outer membrane beta-barrel protein [Bryobacterales bacterium]